MQSATRDLVRYVVMLLALAVAGSSVNAQDASAEAKSPPRIKVYAPGAESPNVIKINEALEQRTSLEFPGNPIDDVMRYIGSIHEIPIVIDESALLAEGINLESEVRIVLSGVTLRSALELILSDVGGAHLDYIIQHEVLLVTSRVKAEETFETRVYDVRALELDDPEILAHVLRHTTSGCWVGVNGMFDGDLSYAKGSFIVRQPQRVHREIETLLNVLARQVNFQDPAPNWPIPKELPPVAPTNAGAVPPVPANN
ncbi:MAG: hypothetical protein R3C18_06575 [Planctomycetaceae bacterium]